ncbi:hypothetical protein ACOSQ3_017654 [Xanthoceras sorbifolium]
MLPIRILVRYDTKIADLSYLKPSDCSVVSIINDAWKEMSGKGVQLFDNWKLSVLFPWNGQQHTVISDEELMIVFETFDNQSKDEIEFEISLNPLGVEYPEEHIGLLTSNNEAPPASENNVTPPATVEEYDSDEDDSYEVDKETGEDNEVVPLTTSLLVNLKYDFNPTTVGHSQVGPLTTPLLVNLKYDFNSTTVGHSQISSIDTLPLTRDSNPLAEARASKSQFHLGVAGSLE